MVASGSEVWCTVGPRAPFRRRYRRLIRCLPAPAHFDLGKGAALARLDKSRFSTIPAFPLMRQDVAPRLLRFRVGTSHCRVADPERRKWGEQECLT